MTPLPATELMNVVPPADGVWEPHLDCQKRMLRLKANSLSHTSSVMSDIGPRQAYVDQAGKPTVGPVDHRIGNGFHIGPQADVVLVRVAGDFARRSGSAVDIAIDAKHFGTHGGEPKRYFSSYPVAPHQSRSNHGH